MCHLKFLFKDNMDELNNYWLLYIHYQVKNLVNDNKLYNMVFYVPTLLVAKYVSQIISQQQCHQLYFLIADHDTIIKVELNHYLLISQQQYVLLYFILVDCVPNIYLVFSLKVLKAQLLYFFYYLVVLYRDTIILVFLH